MKGGGYYDDHSEYQRGVAATGVSFIEQCVAAIAMPPSDRAVVIVDYGASTGANSLASVRAAVEAVRARNAQQPVAAVHNDLPSNDWNQLFGNLASRSDSYAHLGGPPVLPLASAISFFEPAVPPASAHLGVSFSAAHWLRHQPSVAVPEGLYFCEATGAARSELAAQADADWTTFLAARAADLAPGGRLLVQMVGSEPSTSGGEPHVTARKLLRAMSEVARELVAAGKLDAAAVDRYVLAVYARTPDEARAPLERRGTPVADAFAIDTIRTDPVANPYLDRWRADGDAAAYGRSYAAFVRGFTESSLRDHLFDPGVTAGNDPQQVLDDYFARLAARFTADPEADAFEDWTLTVVLTRR
jgi:cyclopropane-fatty-acyl-phospholipid synthase